MKIKQTLINIILPIISAIAVAGLAYAAWVEPTANPPDLNVSAPVNVGPDTQYKSGALGIGGLLAAYSGFWLNNNGQNVSGKVLTADASGFGTWQAQAAGGVYVGATSGTYTGAMGGYDGANTKCNAQYPGSRMCATSDFSTDKRPPDSATGWYSTFTSTHSAGSAGGMNITDCAGWIINWGGTWGGTYWDNTPSRPYWCNGPCSGGCDASRPILCCK